MAGARLRCCRRCGSPRSSSAGTAFGSTPSTPTRSRPRCSAGLSRSEPRGVAYPSTPSSRPAGGVTSWARPSAPPRSWRTSPSCWRASGSVSRRETSSRWTAGCRRRSRADGASSPDARRAPVVPDPRDALVRVRSVGRRFGLLSDQPWPQRVPIRLAAASDAGGGYRRLPLPDHSSRSRRAAAHADHRRRAHGRRRPDLRIHAQLLVPDPGRDDRRHQPQWQRGGAGSLDRAGGALAGRSRPVQNRRVRLVHARRLVRNRGRFPERRHAGAAAAGYSDDAAGKLPGGRGSLCRSGGVENHDGPVAFERRHRSTLQPLESYRAVVVLYAALGVLLLFLSTRLSPAAEVRLPAMQNRFGIGPSRDVVLKLSGLFALDSFAGGFVVQSFAAYWFYLRFGVDPRTLGAIFFGANVLAGVSAVLASRLAARFGLVKTMVFTHLPSNVLLILVPLMPNLPLAILVLFARFSISQMDVPTRQSYTMAVVAPEERSAAAGITGVARTTGAALAPVFAGLLFSRDRKSTRLNSSHSQISYAVFCLKKKKLISIRAEVGVHDAAELFLSRSVRRAVAVCQIEMADAQIERSAQKIPAAFPRSLMEEVA